jgi:hypothetical protein
MATIVTRAAKGSPLTHNEVDANFTNLNTDKAETADLATVATTGAYADLSGTPAAALPLAGGTLTGNVNLDDNVKANFGAGSDLQIYHNGINSYIDEVGTGNLRIRAIDLEIMKAGTGEYMIKGVADGAVTLYHDNAAKLATTATGISVTGDATFADNGKAVFGAGSDLQIYHDGSNSYIDDAGTGNLLIRGSAITRIQSYIGEDMVVAVTNGAVNLYHNNAEKLATTATGISVTGTVVADGLTVDGTGAIKVPVGTEAQRPTPATGQLRFNSDATSFEGYDGSAWGAIGGGGGAGLPSGVIAIWSGAVGAIPSGWVICDGLNSTPDLRDRFIIGAGSTYAVDATGGAATTSTVVAHTHTLSGNTDASGNHTHTGTTSTIGNHQHLMRQTTSNNNNAAWVRTYGTPNTGNAYRNTEPSGTHSHTFTTAAGGDHSHTFSGDAASTGSESVSILNPYYSLCYIMKT